MQPSACVLHISLFDLLHLFSALHAGGTALAVTAVDCTRRYDAISGALTEFHFVRVRLVCEQAQAAKHAKNNANNHNACDYTSHCSISLRHISHPVILSHLQPSALPYHDTPDHPAQSRP
jgi:hypothetical protein